MLIPELPAYLTSLGGAEYKGLIVSLFTVTAMISRPFSGKLADKVGRVPVIMVGAMVCFVCSLFYPIVPAVGAFLLLRLIHGFATGFTPTGQTAYLSDIIPPDRRGEAMGLLGTASSVGMAGGPAIGGLVANQFGLNVMFYCASALGLLSVIILTRIPETLKEKNAFHIRLMKINKADLFEPRVMAPCLVMVLAAYAYGAVLTFLPDFGEYVGIRNKGVLFTYMTLASLMIRLMGGRASDYWGRKPVLRVSVGLIAIAMLTLALAETKLQLIIGVILYGLAQGTTSPTLLAWATDLSNPLHRGRGIASLYIFMELGIGLGAFCSGLIYNHVPLRLHDAADKFTATFMVCSMLAATAVICLIADRFRIKVPS